MPTKTLLQVACILALSISCTKTNIAFQTCYLTEYVSPSQGYTISITYDNNNNVTSYQQNFTGSGTNTYSVTNNANGNITQVQYELAKAETVFSGPTKWVYTYDQNNQLTQEQYFYLDSVTIIGNYSYNSFNQVSQIQSITGKINSQNQVVNPLYGYTLLTYPNTTTKNASSVVGYDGDANSYTGTPIATTTFTYDTQKNLSALFPASLSEMVNLSFPFSDNNVLSCKSVFHSQSGDATSNEVYTYQYNSSGYPISSTFSFSGNKLTYTYNYNCK